MKSIKEILLEKLKLSKNEIKEPPRDLSNVDFKKIYSFIYFKSPSEERGHYDKMDQYFNKKSNPQRLVNSIKDTRKLLIRWYICVSRGYSDYYPVFREDIIQRNIFNEDQLDAYILSRYKRSGGFKQLQENYENYLDEYNVKYDKN